MGLIKTEEQDNGNLLLEITYGGKDSPFGGVDTSAPSAYIDPRCFAAADGFLVEDNKLCVLNLLPLPIPTLWNGVAGVTLLKIGTFYNSLNGQLNYALGYTATSFAGPPGGVSYVFYMTSWNPANIAQNWTDLLPITLFNASSILQQASLTLDCIETSTTAPTTGSGATGTITSVGPGGQITGYTLTGGSNYGVGDVVQLVQGATISGWVKVATLSGSAIATSTLFNAGFDYLVAAVTAGSVEAASSISIQVVGPSGTQTFSLPSYASGYTRQDVVAALVTEYAGLGTDVSLSATPDGYSLIITANVAGVGGNAITVQDVSTSEVSTAPPPFYFSARTPRNLQGGQITQTSLAPVAFNPPASVVAEGGTLYIANLGPMILKYSGPGEFTTSSLYNGMGVLGKFGGNLIGLRQINQLGTYTQNQDMIFAWTGDEDLDEWAPVAADGTVTGAGFEQLADIEDYLSGLIVSNGTAYIIRSQGVSYATVSGNASLPYPINHISLGAEGEGAQADSLVCQYDMTGAFVGNSNVFQIAGSLSPIGDKIKSLLFQSIGAGNIFGNVLSAATCVVTLGGDLFPIVVFSTGEAATPAGSLVLFFFNTTNGTWSTLTFPASKAPFLSQNLLLGVLTGSNTFASEDEYNGTELVLANQNFLVSGDQAPTVFVLTEGIPNVSSTSNPPYVTFPQEEILFGRDVTVDALYVALWSSLRAAATVNFLFNGVLFATLILPTGGSLSGVPTEYQVFSDTTGAGAFTAHSPQLSIQVVPFTTSDGGQVRFSKITVFGTIDPAQRPV